MRVAIPLYCLVVAFLLFAVSDRAEASREVLEALRQRKNRLPKGGHSRGRKLLIR